MISTNLVNKKYIIATRNYTDKISLKPNLNLDYSQTINSHKNIWFIQIRHMQSNNAGKKVIKEVATLYKIPHKVDHTEALNKNPQVIDEIIKHAK